MINKLFRKSKSVKALDDISFTLERNKTVAVVGESGCGKSTLAKALMNLESRTFGEVKINGKETLKMPTKDFKKSIQMIFQDPYSSINPRKKAWQIIAEPLFINTDLRKK